jgi:hypothetical protein
MAPLPAAIAPVEGPPRQISIVPRFGLRIQTQSFPMPERGETAVVVTNGVILTVRHADEKVGLVDIEADRLVFWTHDKSSKVLDKLRSPEGQTTRKMEFFLSGNVEIRQQTGPDARLLRADEVFYDVGRNVAIALRADLEIKQKGLLDPFHIKADELFQLSPTNYRATRAEVFSSRLPSDPGLTVVVADAALDEKKVPRTTIFGKTFIDPKTGQPILENQQIFTGRDVFFEFDRVPFFYFPYIKGDVQEPLGPLRNLSFNYNRIFGYQVFTTWDLYDLLGMTKLPGTKWSLEADYMTERGPALGSNFDYAGRDFLGMPSRYVGQVKGYFINDTGEDVLGGGRGTNDNHPEQRGRFFWRQDIQDLPCGFTVQSQVSYLSDHNFLEQYYKREFDQDPNQETFLYVKQQQGNWAWTALVEPRIRNWVTETEWLPKGDGYLIGQSLFNLLTYDAHASAGYAMLRIGQVPGDPVTVTDRPISTGRVDLWQDLSLPLALGPVKVVPYLVGDMTYYTEDLTGSGQGRLYGAAGVRASMPMSRLYTNIESLFFNLNGIYHKIIFSGNYYNAKSDVPYTQFPQLDRLDDDATDQARRDITPLEPVFVPGPAGKFLATSPLFNPQVFAIRNLVDNRVDTLNTIDVFEADIRQRWQTKRGYPGQQHIVDWMTLDLSASFFPHSNRDNFGETVGLMQYDYTWNVGDRTALTSTGWFEPITNGPRVFTVGAFLNRTDKTNFFIGYRQIDPIDSKALTVAVTYVFSPKYAISGASTYDFGSNKGLSNALILTRMGRDVRLSFGITYNAILNTVGATFEIMPNVSTNNRRIAGMPPVIPGMPGQ